MELLFESRIEVTGIEGKVYPFQETPELYPEPVVQPDTEWDASGASIYGTVLRDGGKLRMWYQGWPKTWDGTDSAAVCYAESDDGIVWTKPKLKNGGKFPESGNNCNLGFHCPSVFIDPDAPSSHRYRATGFCSSAYATTNWQPGRRGYFTAHSSDGLNWELDQELPQWDGSDVITSIYHEGQGRGIIALKQKVRVGGIRRRAIWSAELSGGEWSPDICALVPDAYDDICAVGHGFRSADYYGMGMMPAGNGTVGFLWQFRHDLPRTADKAGGHGVFGATDVSLVYQPERGARWLHFPGRKNFLTHGSLAWNEGGIYTASCPVDVGDETRLYHAGTLHSHGWSLDSDWNRLDRRVEELTHKVFTRIGFCRWKKNRLFGFRSDPEGILDLELPVNSDNAELSLNFRTEGDGVIRVELPEIEGRSAEAGVPMTGNSMDETVRWKDGTNISAGGDSRIKVRLHMEKAKVFAYRVS